MKLIFLNIFLSFFLATQAFSFPMTPNPDLSQGSLCTKQDEDYVEDRYKEKIPYCLRNVSTRFKKEIYALYDIPEKCHKFYTIDHIIPLAIGGDNSLENLWPEHEKVKGTRPQLEQQLFNKMKNGTLKQKDAVRIILKEKFSQLGMLSNKTKCN